MDDYEVVAEELSQFAEKMRGLEECLAEVERVNTRLEEAALTTARALGEVSRHWDACTTPCAAQTESTGGSRPSATTMPLWRVVARTSEGPASRALRRMRCDRATRQPERGRYEQRSCRS
jgi:hypothetical protein